MKPESLIRMFEVMENKERFEDIETDKVIDHRKKGRKH